MQKIHFLIVCTVLFFTTASRAQTPVNGGFENWTPSGNPAPFDWEEPTGWTSSNSLTEWTKAGVKKEAPGNTGNYALRLESVMISDGWYSMICNGKAKKIMDFSAPRLDIITGGEPIPGFIPDILRGFYKFTARTAGDSGYALVILKKWNSGSNEYDTIGIGSKKLGPASSYTKLEVPIKKIMTGDPDSVVVALYSTNPNNPTKPADFTKLGELIADDIWLDRIGGFNDPNSKPVFQVGPNPATDHISIRGETGVKMDATLISADGKTAAHREGTGSIRIEKSPAMRPGIYFLKITAGNKTQVQKILLN